MSKVELLSRVLVHDKDGKLVSKTEWTPSKSFLFQFLQLLRVLMKHTALATVLDITNTARTPAPCASGAYQFMYAVGADDTSGDGIVVGTGATAVTNLDYKLETKIVHGVGATQLDYGGTNFTDPSEVGANIDFVMSRTFYNDSGSTIVVAEIGIYGKTQEPAPYTFCLIRDVLVATVDVLDTQTLTVQYTLRTTA